MPATVRCSFIYNRHRGLLCSFAEHAVFSHNRFLFYPISETEPLEGNAVWQITIILKRHYFDFKIKAPLEHIWVSFNEADEPRVYYTEWSESEREKKILDINAYIWKLERWYWWTSFQGSNGDTDIENRLTIQAVAGRRERVQGMEKSSLEMYIPICKIDSQWELALWLGELNPELGNSLEGCDGVGGGREV